MEDIQRTSRGAARRKPPTDKRELWIKRVLSFIGLLYSVMLVYFDYNVFFYEIQYTNRMRFAVVGAVICVAVCALYLYTRKNFFTCFAGMMNLVLFFPMLMMDWGNWPLLIPAAVVTLFGFFSCHVNDTAKTVFGTIFLLVYILGGIAFYMFTNMFQAKTVDTLIEEQASPSGEFRYYLLDVKNQASGKMQVYVQPNELDKDNGMFKLATSLKKMVKQVNKPADIKCEWNGDKLLINGEVYFTESKHFEKNAEGETIYQIENDNWQYTCFDLDYPVSKLINTVKNTIEKRVHSGDEETGGADTDNASDETEEVSGGITAAQTDETALTDDRDTEESISGEEEENVTDADE